MIFPHQHIRLLLVISLLLLIVGIWMWVGNTPQGGLMPNNSEYENITVIELPMYNLVLTVPKLLTWVPESPQMHTTGAFLVTNAEIIGHALFSRDAYPGTNLFDAYLQVAVAKGGSEAQCSTGQQDGNTRVLQFTRSGTVAGRIAYAGTFNGAAAGTFFDGVVTRVYANGTCYEFSSNIFSGNMGNYPEGAITEFPEDEVRSVMQSIINSAELTTQ
ncbi:MAG: hypothetical protein AAB343_02755 [Patescibacteria group bacterium]